MYQDCCIIPNRKMAGLLALVWASGFASGMLCVYLVEDALAFLQSLGA